MVVIMIVVVVFVVSVGGGFGVVVVVLLARIVIEPMHISYPAATVAGASCTEDCSQIKHSLGHMMPVCYEQWMLSTKPSAFGKAFALEPRVGPQPL